MIHLALFLICASGFLLLCLSQPRHGQTFTGQRTAYRAQTMLRIGGAALLLLALVVAWQMLDWGTGSVAWLAHLSAGALLVIFLLNRRSAARK